MRKVKLKIVLALLALGTIGSLALVYDGYGALQTVSVQALSGVTAAGPSAVLRNVGQSQHSVVYCVAGSSGTVSTAQIQLEGSFDATTWFPISDVSYPNTTGTGCWLLEAGGYWPNVRVNLLAWSATGNLSLSAWYTGTAGPISNAGQATVRNRAAGSPLYGNSRSVRRSYIAQESAVNPAIGTVIFALQPTAVAPPIIYLDKAFIFATAATTVDFSPLNTYGTTCTNTGTNTGRQAPGAAFGATAKPASASDCGVAPTAGNAVLSIPVPANTLVTVDLSGFSTSGTSNAGWALSTPAALTGTIKISGLWFEDSP
jgi:hypothetical protein